MRDWRLARAWLARELRSERASASVARPKNQSSPRHGEPGPAPVALKIRVAVRTLVDASGVVNATRWALLGRRRVGDVSIAATKRRLAVRVTGPCVLRPQHLFAAFGASARCESVYFPLRLNLVALRTAYPAASSRAAVLQLAVHCRGRRRNRAR